MKRGRILTKEQVEYRNSLLKKRGKKKNPIPKWVHPSETLTGIDRTVYFMNNCMYWINERNNYRKCAIQAVASLKELCNEFEYLITNQPPNQ